jgi:hypothetical protein
MLIKRQRQLRRLRLLLLLLLLLLCLVARHLHRLQVKVAGLVQEHNLRRWQGCLGKLLQPQLAHGLCLR